MLQVEPVAKGHRITLHYNLAADTKQYIWNTPPVVALSTAMSTSSPLVVHCMAPCKQPWMIQQSYQQVPVVLVIQIVLALIQSSLKILFTSFLLHICKTRRPCCMQQTCSDDIARRGEVIWPLLYR